MKKLEKFTEKAANILNGIAGFAVVAATALIVVNVFLRKLLNSPIQGSYEYTEYLAAITVSFGLAYCAVQNSHIAIEFIIEKLGKGTQRIIEVTTQFVSVILLGAAAWKLVQHATSLMSKGEVSMTTQTPFYIFIYLTAFGVAVLALVTVLKGINALIGVTGK